MTNVKDFLDPQAHISKWGLACSTHFDINTRVNCEPCQLSRVHFEVAVLNPPGLFVFAKIKEMIRL